MRILVDADACPVKKEVIVIGKKYNITVHLFADVNHVLDEYEALVTIVDQGADCADLALINEMNPGDLVITSDYGVASLALARKGFILHPRGQEITNDNIDQLMLERHLSREQRQRGGRGTRHKKRTTQDNIRFSESLDYVIKRIGGIKE